MDKFNRFLQMDAEVMDLLQDKSFDRFLQQDLLQGKCCMTLALKSLCGLQGTCIMEAGQYSVWVNSIYIFIKKQSEIIAASDWQFQHVWVTQNCASDRATFKDISYNFYRWFLLSNTSAINVHAATVVCHDKAIMFIGQSGAGKSTQARLWVQYTNSWVLNYDKPSILRLNDVFYAAGTPWGGKENYVNNRVVPALAMVNVIKAEYNGVEKVSKKEARHMVSGCFQPLLVNKKMADTYFERINEIVENIPLYNLYCTPDEGAVEVLYNELFNNYINERRGRCMKVKKGYVMKKVLDDWLIFPSHNNVRNLSPVVTNEVGAVIWNIMKTECTFEQIVEEIVSEFEVAHSIAIPDVKRFIAQLEEMDMIE